MKYSYNFGTLTDGTINFAPKPITVDEGKYWTNSEEIHRLAGFLPVVRTEMPYSEGMEYVPRFEAEGTPPRIVEHWDSLPVESEPET